MLKKLMEALNEYTPLQIQFNELEQSDIRYKINDVAEKAFLKFSIPSALRVGLGGTLISVTMIVPAIILNQYHYKTAGLVCAVVSMSGLFLSTGAALILAKMEE
jgi:hypothetical protein